MIPAHLRDFPRDVNGLPVTWASAWSREVDRPPVVLPESLLDYVPAIFTRAGQFKGEPDNAKPNVQRTRRCVLEERCQVCGEDVDDLLIGSLVAGWDRLRVDGRMVPLLIDAWTCGRCLPYALKTCPHLLARKTPLRVLRVKDWLPVPTPERPKYMTAEAMPYGPVGFVKIAVLAADEVTA